MAAMAVHAVSNGGDLDEGWWREHFVNISTVRPKVRGPGGPSRTQTQAGRRRLPAAGDLLFRLP